MTPERSVAEMIGLLRDQGYLVEKIVAPDGVRDPENYRPYSNPWSIYSPWANDPLLGEVLAELKAHGAKTLVSLDRLHLIMTLARHCARLDGEFWEAGVYQGGTALLLRKVIQAESPRVLRLFDTFSGMPETRDEVDLHKAGDFGDSSLALVRKVVGETAVMHQGEVPATFAGLEASRIALAHVDLDIHDAVKATCAFVYPRLAPGGVMIFDDYGYHTCPGARVAVDDFFADRPEAPLCLPTGQALVTRLPHSA